MHVHIQNPTYMTLASLQNLRRDDHIDIYILTTKLSNSLDNTNSGGRS